ncbi:MAG: site-specific DNA-methyltransferase [Chromatiaceae bacterium]|nr:site-specific DNA-methyltransferase [Chromatiaceae bacterium]MCF7996242.1 site-specific DNA-methyltransferase [Chromatiaceae bacterium]MCF8004815.1 site-specific DNA-methyltransferase [Chromatiaceae bacterium]MCF8017693.1 site-specific DNA-methyltransferase [Chromatiaceae bacterium]
MPSLHWTGKDQAVIAAREVPYRPLLAVPNLDHGEPDNQNLLIQGDNLDALKSLLPVYAGRVKCVFIDPPYNTLSAFEHYDDNREHSIWLSMMYPRLELLRELLSEDGSIWVTIDDTEAHYLKVMMDEIFGRRSFIADISWRRRDGAPNDRKIGSTYDHLLVFAKVHALSSKKTHAEEAFNLMQRTEKADSQYRLYEEPFGFDERGSFRKIDSTGNAKGGRFVESLIYPVTNPFTGEQVYPRKGRCWVYKREEMEAMIADRRFFWGKDGRAGTPMRKLFKSEAKAGMTAPTIWDDVGLNQHAARELEVLFGEKAFFETPKPEGLLHRVIQIATNPNDLILDSFLGSGTTAAVAHKMGRHWIGVEMGDHAETHCAARLRKVVDGETGGISQAVGWQGGGGFRFCRLGEPVFDGHGSIRPNVSFAELARWVWYRQTHQPLAAIPDSPLLGVHQGTAYYLLFNGILGDRRPDGGNVLTAPVLAALPPYDGPRVVFGEACRLHESRLAALDVRFRQLPYQANDG